MVKKKIIILVFLACLSDVTAFACTLPTISIQQNDAFRLDVMQFVQQSATGTNTDANMDKHWFNGGGPAPYWIRWSVKVSVYVDGVAVGSANANHPSLCETLQQASVAAVKKANLDSKQLEKARFKITFYYPPDSRQYSMVNHGDKTYELIGNIIPVRQMDMALLKERIQSEKAYLLRIMDSDTHAFFKKYDAASDQRGIKLRTIYTASSLYTLLKVQSVSHDPDIEKEIKPITQFLLMMQESQGENAGAFHYSYDKTRGKKDGRFVVGTASKTIFTLLMLYERVRDEKYLNAAKQAGNWLMTKVDASGHVTPVVAHVNGKLLRITKQSFLYSGQILSALSRLYAVTGDKAYYHAATNIAQRMLQYVKKKSAFIGDEYREPNSVTTSWVVMSLVDYAKINAEPIYRETITQCATELVNRQIQAPWDAFNDGRLMDNITSSGNGWVNEVMTELYSFCKEEKMAGCRSYRHFIIHSSRWLMQNVYTPANSFDIKNPEMADGGVIRIFAEKSIRTDAVCHSLNSLVGLLKITDIENPAFPFLPEMPFEEVLGLLEKGGATTE
ncbi:MAG: hypothetical protein MRK01_02995 [Candidatus Scalindua sp.]|nr:hypothetical protein [Candidatus Scalindua sp.]